MVEKNFMKYLITACSSDLRPIISRKIKLFSFFDPCAPIHDSTNVTQRYECQGGRIAKLWRYTDPKTDHAFKTLFKRPSNKRYFIGFLDRILDKPGNEKMTDVSGMDTENVPQYWEGPKRSIFDMKCLGKNGWKQGWQEWRKGLANLNVSKNNIAIPFSRSFHGSATQEAKFYDPMYDVVFKKVFGNEQTKDLTANFLNNMLEFEGDRRVSKILRLSIDDMHPAGKKGKPTTLEIFCEDQNGDRFLIEMQKAKGNAYIGRAQYYLSNRFGTQLGNDEPYNEAKAYYMISILNYKLFPHEEPVSVYSIKNMTHPKNMSHDKLKWIYIELPKVEHWKGLKGHEGAGEWLNFLSKASKLHEIPQGVSPEIKRAYELIEEKSLTEMERKKAMEQEESELNFKEFVGRQMYYSKKEGMQKGRKEGMQKGMRKGRKEGRKEGMQKEKKGVARRMLAQDVSIEAIQSFTELSKEEIQAMKDDMDSER